MSVAFKSDAQGKAFQAVLSGLRKVGYRGSLLREHYSFGDWFQAGHPLRSVPAAGFGYFPPSYENACVAVLVPDKATGFQLVSQYRALGAPLAFEVKEDSVSL